MKLKTVEREYQKFIAEENAANEKELEFVKANINYDFNLMSEMLEDTWSHIGYFEMEKSNYKSGAYPSYDFYREKDNPKSLEYMRQDDDGEYHNLVWQTVGCCGDDFSGFLLFPLSNGKYWKISFEC